MKRIDVCRRAAAAMAAAALAGCGGGNDAPEQAEPGDRVTATPVDSGVVRGADQPGPQYDND
ncbi:MAG: hypothetical protein KY467_13015 [Gemmatimonadetes bacterium]|nr:hypothetical protein [Gemmatimonadota bacterium]